MGIEAILKKSILFENMTDDELSRISGIWGIPEGKIYRKSSVICKRGELGDSLYLIHSGKVRISIPTEEEEIVLAELGPAKFFGEISLIDEGKRSATAVAVEDCKIVIITRSLLKKLLETEPQIGIKFLLSLSNVFCKRIRVLDERLLE